MHSFTTQLEKSNLKNMGDPSGSSGHAQQEIRQLGGWPGHHDLAKHTSHKTRTTYPLVICYIAIEHGHL